MYPTQTPGGTTTVTAGGGGVPQVAAGAGVNPTSQATSGSGGVAQPMRSVMTSTNPGTVLRTSITSSTPGLFLLLLLFFSSCLVSFRFLTLIIHPHPLFAQQSKTILLHSFNSNL